jgi:acetyl-CoA carboxylase carboxyl transferase subunit alpha
MAMNFLEFEQPIAELEAKIEELKFLGKDSSVNITEEIKRLQSKSRALTSSIFANLSPWQITQLARHPQRPYTLDYVSMIFTDWHELHGDRMYSDDLAIVGGLARLEGTPVMLIGHQKGRDTKERVRRNYGMPKPEGYRKALRLMMMAERFRIPVITLIDTPGAYPGIGSEERGQSEAIARNLFEMSNLAAPVLSVVIGEGGSGGALAIACAIGWSCCSSASIPSSHPRVAPPFCGRVRKKKKSPPTPWAAPQSASGSSDWPTKY